MILKKDLDLAILKAEVEQQIAEQLGFNPNNPPVSVDEDQAAKVLDNKPNTLAVWRSTGRYSLPYIKVGRSVRYRISDLAEFLARRTSSHTGEVL